MLSAWECTLLRCLPSGRWLFRLLCTVALVGLVLWVVVRLWSALSAGFGDSLTTLFNPSQLQDAIARFAAMGPNGPTGVAPGGARHRTEQLCRQLLEAMLHTKLPKVRPRWLTNPTTKRALELDMYSAELKLGFEYDGAQHDVFTPHFHTNKHHFEYRKLLDRLKTELCREAQVKLIRIPWREVSVSDEMRTARYLEGVLETHGIPFRRITGSA